jgi:hypothetical protein
MGAVVPVIQWAVLLTCLTRGLDYLRPDLDPTSVLSRVQDSAPLPVWGVAFIAAATVSGVGLLGRWGLIAAVGHIAAMAAYAGIALGLFQSTGIGPGARTPVGLAVTAVIHGALGVGIFASLRRREMIAALPDEET